MISIVRYDPSMAARWDDFVRQSSNGTLLHLRGYMDYHSDRFTDCSLIAFDPRGRIVGLLPANASGRILHSHQGLTYGGWITGTRHFASDTMLEAWDAMVAWMRYAGFSELSYKPIPQIYHRYPADDDLYSLFRLGAQLETCQISSAIPVGEPWLSNQDARQKVRNAGRDGTEIRRSSDFPLFMKMLSMRLDEKYGAVPVHSLAEMELLAGRFPDNIRLIMAYDPCGEPLAGTIIYRMPTVVHTQYIATTEAGRRQGVFAAVTSHLLENECIGCRWLDFGTSCEQAGRILNASLNRQKYGLGGRPVAYLTLRLSL